MRNFRILPASMTVEASLVLPLFLLFFLQLGSFMEVMRLHGRVEMALWETGREICLYGTALSKGTEKREPSDNAVWKQVGNLALSYTFVKGRVEEYLGRDYLEEAPILGGSRGLQYVSTELLGEDGQVDMIVTYLPRLPWRIAETPIYTLENHYLGRMWTGYDVTKNREAVYYLVENMSVYHRDRSCTHLQLTVNKVSRGQLAVVVNEKGNRYRACTKCKKYDGGYFVYIAEQGDCYHERKDCPGLKRTVREVGWEEASNYRPCSRCCK